MIFITMLVSAMETEVMQALQEAKTQIQEIERTYPDLDEANFQLGEISEKEINKVKGTILTWHFTARCPDGGWGMLFKQSLEQIKFIKPDDLYETYEQKLQELMNGDDRELQAFWIKRYMDYIDTLQPQDNISETTEAVRRSSSSSAEFTPGPEEDAVPSPVKPAKLENPSALS